MKEDQKPKRLEMAAAEDPFLCLVLLPQKEYKSNRETSGQD